MGSWMGLIGSVVVVIAALAQCTAAQTNHVVGDTSGWMIPSSNQVYETWAGSQTFAVGDNITFNFNAENHDVAQVTKADFDSCTTTNSLSISRTSPTTIRLNSTGELYYICTIPTHCSRGQKVAINVTSTTGSPSPFSPPTGGAVPPTAGATPPPPSSSAPSTAAGFGVAGIFIATLTALFL